MSIVDEQISTIWCPHSKEHYESLGYVFVGYGKRFSVSTTQLPHGSEKVVKARCDGCGQERSIPRYAYRDLCTKCAQNEPSTQEKKRRAMEVIWSDQAKRVEASRIGSENALRGPESPHWKAEKTAESREEERKTPEYHLWRKHVYQRDHYACTACGYDRGGILVAHHLEGWKENEDLRYEVSNGVTLCEPCHLEFHGAYGYRHNTRRQFDDFLQRKGVETCLEAVLSGYPPPQNQPTPTVVNSQAS